MAAARPRVIAALAAQLRDLDLAEEAHDAAVEALLAQAGEVRDVAAWLYVAARRKALDLLRKRKAEQRWSSEAMAGTEPMAEIIELPDPIPDERLRLIFICCHPAIAPEARVALALRIVCGVSVEAIAGAFLLNPAAMYQRITRSKAKIRLAGVPFETPGRREWPERVEAVLATLEIAYAVAYREAADQSDLAELREEVVRLSALLAELLPAEAEALGMHALVLLASSRSRARVDAGGAMVPLSQQDTDLWDHEAISRARIQLDRAAELGAPGPVQLLAAIHLVHAKRSRTGETDWETIVRLYDRLALLRPTAVVGINRAVAIGRWRSGEEGLAALAELDAGKLEGFLPFHVARADLLARAGQLSNAKDEYRSALAAGPGGAERRWIAQQLAALGD
ncbi:RNA polymerase subunit sigma-24 [Altererythrobacter sp. BO-6]|nr:RNA polymerase subunit sigma-24 [Altererythrobacter sp. BO-6]